MLIQIDRVKVSDRIRKDYGDLSELADDIKENGLINPPVVTPDYELIAGERRLRAMKLLGYEQIEVRVMKVNDYEHMLNLEISENESRKDFTKSERIQYARQLERIERVKAKERMGQGVQNFAQLEEGKTRDIVAEKLGIGSGEQYRKEKYIAENADNETLEKWDKGDITTHKAYTKLKQEKEQLEQALQAEKNKPAKVIKERVEVPPHDYESLKVSVGIKQKEINNLKEKLDRFQKDSEEYNRLKEQIEFLHKEKDDLDRRIESATELSGLAVKIDNFLKTELAPIRYSRCFERMDSEVARDNLLEIIESVETWCYEIKQLIPEEYRRVTVIK